MCILNVKLIVIADASVGASNSQFEQMPRFIVRLHIFTMLMVYFIVFLLFLLYFVCISYFERFTKVERVV